MNNPLLKAFSSLLPVTTGKPFVSNPSQLYPINNGLTLYPTGKDRTFIKEGYNKNALVYSIVSKCAKKFAQVPWYHYKIKRGERKTWFDEYLPLTKSMLHDSRARAEMKRMRVKSVDQVIVDDELSALIAKPNRNLTGAQLREQLYGYKLLTGEGNLWLFREDQDSKKKLKELLIIPKANIGLVSGKGFDTIEKIKVLLFGNEYINDPANFIMWKFPNYDFDPVTLSHLRGQSPLDAYLLDMQGGNEGRERIAAMNKNQGVAGLAYNRADQRQWTPEQAIFNRRQFNSIINDSDLAGTIAYMNGDWGYLQFGLSTQQLQLLEQTNIAMDTICNIYDVPPGMFSKDQTYENRKEQKREFIYDNIAVAAYSLRDELNAKLIPEFKLDRESHVIDADLMSLPELSEDLKKQADTVKTLWYLTPNQALEYLGFDRSTDPNMNKVYAPSSLTPLDQLNSDLGGNLDEETNLLGLDDTDR